MTSSGQCGTDSLSRPDQPSASSSDETHNKPGQGSDYTPVLDPTSSTDVSAVAAFPCALCGAVFADGLALAVHEREHGAALHCSLCARSFRLEGDLRRHERRHGRRGIGAARPTESVTVGPLVNSEQECPPRPGDERAVRDDRTVERGSAVDVTVSGVDREVVSSATSVLPATTVAITKQLVEKDGHHTGALESRPSQDCPLQAVNCPSENNPSQAADHSPQNHTPRTEDCELQAENSAIQVPEDTSVPVADAPTSRRPALASGSSKGTSEALKVPFQCAVCHARFGRVSWLQKHVKSHARTDCRPSPEKESAPRRSRRRRPVVRTVGDGIGSSAVTDGSDAVSEVRSTRERARPASTVVAKSSRSSSKGTTMSGHVTGLHSASDGAKLASVLVIPSHAINSLSADGLEPRAATSPVRSSPTLAPATKNVAPSLKNIDLPSAQPEARTETVDRMPHRNPRRRAARRSVVLANEEESGLDDAQTSPSPSPASPPQVAHTTVASVPVQRSRQIVRSMLAKSDQVAELLPIGLHHVTQETVSSARASSSLPPTPETKATSDITAAGVQSDGEPTKIAANVPVSVLAVARTEVPVPGEFECDVCHRRLAHRHALARHRQMHFARESFQCDKCDRRYSRFDSLVTHSRKHASEATHRCSFCPKAYRLRSLLEYHEREHHKEGDTPAPAVKTARFECTECGKTFSYMTALRRHTRLHLGGQKYYCELCPKRYSRFDVLVLHSRVHSKLTPFECVICARSFSQRRILEYHTSMHAGAMDATQPPYKCTICARSFPDAVQLREHRRRHPPNRSFLCDMCGKEFRSANKLRRHVMTHTGERPLHCNICGRRFVDSTSLTQHARTHSGERPFQCHVCGKSFSRNVTLKIHARTHSGEKPYPCDVCGRAFTTVTQLRRHVRVHSGERPYLCGICGRGFSQTTHRKVHMRTHAPRPGDAQDGRRVLEEQQQRQEQQQHEHVAVSLSVPPPQPSSMHESHQPPLQALQHQQGPEHQALYALQAELPEVAPMDIEGGNITLHFMHQ